MSLNFPILLFNQDKEKLRRVNVIRSTTFYFYSYKPFNVEIIVGDVDTLLYSAVKVDNTVQVTNGNQLLNNHGYTLYMPNNNSNTVIRVYNDDYSIEYSFNTIFENVFDTTNQHYKDLLANYKLPTSFKQLADAVPDEFDESELLKRLLLDYQEIQKYCGTKKGIRQYLKFLGFDEDQIQVQDIYHNIEKDMDVLTPDKSIDFKTGDYHVMYLNYDTVDTEFDANNMPTRYLIIDDIDGFKFAILNAIVLANEYFTTDEQDITYFGLGYSANNPKYNSMVGDMHIINEHDTIKFRDDIKIGMLTNENKTTVISNTVLRTEELYTSEAKVYSTNGGSLVYKVDKEYFDTDVNDEIDDTDIINIHKIFGCVIHLKIESPDTYIKYTLIDDNNPLIRLVSDKIFYSSGESIYDIIAISNISSYTLTVTIYDQYNNREEYNYKFELSTSAQRIDFNSFNTGLVSDDYKYTNGITLDVNNSGVVTEPVNTNNFILPLDSIPENLADYFNTILQSDQLTYLQSTETYEIADMNKFLLLSQISETLPVYYLNNWVQIISRKYVAGWSLKIRLYDVDIAAYRITNISDLKNYDPIFDTIYCQMTELYADVDATVSYPYYYIMTTVPGIDFTTETYDLLLVNDTTGEIKSFYDDMEPTKKLNISYDFPFIPLECESVPSFVGYISNTGYREKCVEGSDVEYPMIKSIFPRMINIDNQTIGDELTLAYGDYILCVLDSKYVAGVKDIKWSILNAFTSEVLFTTEDATLKYQIGNNIIYTILVTFKIGGKSYTITKESLFSSFKADI